MSTNTFHYTICSTPNVYIFVYILIETRIAPLKFKKKKKKKKLSIFLVQEQLQPEILRTPCLTQPGFKLMTSRSWQYTSLSLLSLLEFVFWYPKAPTTATEHHLNLCVYQLWCRWNANPQPSALKWFTWKRYALSRRLLLKKHHRYNRQFLQQKIYYIDF